MKMINISAGLKSIGAAALIGGLLFTSCSKEENTGSAGAPQAEMTPINDKKIQQKLQDLAQNVKGVAVYNKTMDKVIILDPHNTKNFSFTDPNPGWNIGTNTGIQFVADSDGNTIVFVDPGTDPFANVGSGSGSGGTVVAGNATLNIDFAMCFSASEEALGLDLLETDVSMDGISGVIGIGGDFESLMNVDFSEEGTDPFEYFFGMAYYLVYDDQPSGSYPILNAFDGEYNEGEDFFSNKGYAFIMALQGNGAGFYMSNSGTLNVSGGSMEFQGTYFAILGFFDMEENEISMDAYEVNGFGAMGCN